MARSADPELALRRRRQILEAALACFSRRGFHQASMQEICAEAGLSAGALYRYFSSKNDIIAAIAEDHRRKVMESVDRVDPDAPLLETMLRVFAAAFDRVRELGGSLIGDVIAEASRDAELAARLRSSDDGIRAILEQGLRAAQRRGAVDAALDPGATARVIEAFLDGMVLRIAVIPGADRDEGLADARLFLTRLLSPKALSKPAPARRVPVTQEG